MRCDAIDRSIESNPISARMNLSRRCALSTLGEERSIDRNAGAPPRSGVDASTDGDDGSHESH
jgi:hypothetical protein